MRRVVWHRRVRRWRGTGRGGLSESAVTSVATVTRAGREQLTKSSLDLPLSLALNGYAMSKPVSGSVRRRKTWWARFAVRPS